MKFLVIIFMLIILTGENCVLLNPIQELIKLPMSDIFHKLTKYVLLILLKSRCSIKDMLKSIDV